MQSAPLADLVGWVAAADCCQLHELRLRCISEVVRRLASRQGGLSGAFADAALMVGHLDKSVLAQLLGLVLAAGGEQVASNLAAPSAAVEALDQAANPGSFEWELERYSQQPGGVGRKAESPWFSVAGREWCLRVYPGGYTEETAGHLSGERRLRYYSCSFLHAAASPPVSFLNTISHPCRSFPLVQAGRDSRQVLHYPCGPGSRTGSASGQHWFTQQSFQHGLGLSQACQPREAALPPRLPGGRPPGAARKH